MPSPNPISISAQKARQKEKRALDGVGPLPLRTNWRSPNTRVPAEETKRRLWREKGYLIVSIDDPRLASGWADRELLTAVAEKLYGKRIAQPDRESNEVS